MVDVISTFVEENQSHDFYVYHQRSIKNYFGAVISRELRRRVGEGVFGKVVELGQRPTNTLSRPRRHCAVGPLCRCAASVAAKSARLDNIASSAIRIIRACIVYIYTGTLYICVCIRDRWLCGYAPGLATKP